MFVEGFVKATKSKNLTEPPDMAPGRYGVKYVTCGWIIKDAIQRTEPLSSRIPMAGSATVVTTGFAKNLVAGYTNKNLENIINACYNIKNTCFVYSYAL